jgi:hypothetical protein
LLSATAITAGSAQLSGTVSAGTLQTALLSATVITAGSAQVSGSVYANAFTGASAQLSGTVSAGTLQTALLSATAITAGNAQVSGTVYANAFTGASAQVSGTVSAGTLQTALLSATAITAGSAQVSGTVSAGTLQTALLSAAAITAGSAQVSGSLTALNIISGNSNTIGNIFTTGGNVGVGTTAPAYSMHVVGNIFATGDVTCFSDARYKTNIQPLASCLDKIDSISGVSYERLYNSGGPDVGKRYIGVLAQEVEAAFPELVAFDQANDIKSVAYGNITAVLIECIKELKQEINSMKRG